MKCLTRTDIQTIGRRIREVEERVTITGRRNNNNNIHHNTEAVTLQTTTTAIITREDEGVADTSHPEIEVPVQAEVGTISRVTAIVPTATTPLKILNHNKYNSHNTILKVHRRFILRRNNNNTNKLGVDHTNLGVTGEDLRDI